MGADFDAPNRNNVGQRNLQVGQCVFQLPNPSMATAVLGLTLRTTAVVDCGQRYPTAPNGLNPAFSGGFVDECFGALSVFYVLDRGGASEVEGVFPDAAIASAWTLDVYVIDMEQYAKRVSGDELVGGNTFVLKSFRPVPPSIIPPD